MITFFKREVLQTVRMPQLRYPYTLGAMLRQFPLKYHMGKSWIYKAYALGLVLSAPIFFKITNIFPAEVNASTIN